MQPISAITTAPATTPDLETEFRRMVGSVFYGQMLKALRSTVGKPAYIDGGQAEELFQSQLDQTVVEDLSGRNGGPWMDELFQLFQQQLDQRSPLASPAQPPQLHQPAQPIRPASLAELAETVRQTQPAPQVAGITTGTAALSALIRK